MYFHKNTEELETQFSLQHNNLDSNQHINNHYPLYVAISLQYLYSKFTSIKSNTIPWNLKNDLQFFRYITSKTKDLTKRNAIIVGRKTFQTFPKPLPNRLNIIVTSNPNLIQTTDNIQITNTFENAIQRASEDSTIENIFIIGGVLIYEAAMQTGLVKRIYLTRIKGDFQCTTIWSSLDLTNYRRIESIPDDIEKFFHTPTEPEHHLEIYEKKD